MRQNENKKFELVNHRPQVNKTAAITHKNYLLYRWHRLIP